MGKSTIKDMQNMMSDELEKDALRQKLDEASANISNENCATATEKLLQLAESGDADAQTNLGVLYAKGEGVVQYNKAVKWFRRAAEAGNAQAQAFLGGMYYFGEGVVQNYQTAHVWLNIASVNGPEWVREFREKVEKHLSPDALVEAQNIAKKCPESNYTNCP